MNRVGLQLRLQSDCALPALVSDFLDFLSRQAKPLQKFLMSLNSLTRLRYQNTQMFPLSLSIQITLRFQSNLMFQLNRSNH